MVARLAVAPHLDRRLLPTSRAAPAKASATTHRDSLSRGPCLARWPRSSARGRRPAAPRRQRPTPPGDKHRLLLDHEGDRHRSDGAVALEISASSRQTPRDARRREQVVMGARVPGQLRTSSSQTWRQRQLARGLGQADARRQARNHFRVGVGLVVAVVEPEGLPREAAATRLAAIALHRMRPALGVVGAGALAEARLRFGVSRAERIRTTRWNEHRPLPRADNGARAAHQQPHAEELAGRRDLAQALLRCRVPERRPVTRDSWLSPAPRDHRSGSGIPALHRGRAPRVIRP